MLDRLKLVVELQKVADQLFIDSGPSYHLAQDIWQRICHDPIFLYKVRQVSHAPWPVPLWNDTLSRIAPISHHKSSYIALSVDGSQIYPDRHNVLSCFLINTGSVVLPYGIAGEKVDLFSQPTVFAGVDENQQPFTTDGVNCKRQELELKAGLDLASTIKSRNGDSLSVLLFDGSLIFWHLSSKEIDVRNHYLNSYLVLLDQLYTQQVLVCWYISMPKSKELISLVRLYLCDFDVDRKELYEPVEGVIDSGIMWNFLEAYQRTIVFSNHSAISDYYPSHLRPYFFYLHTGNEIGRVEIPSWIAQDECLVDLIAEVVIDQCVKGAGYPVALAEAHEQAVVKGPDREFFYHLLQKMGMERNHIQSISRKSIKKRGIGI